MVTKLVVKSYAHNSTIFFFTELHYLQNLTGKWFTNSSITLHNPSSYKRNFIITSDTYQIPVFFSLSSTPASGPNTIFEYSCINKTKIYAMGMKSEIVLQSAYILKKYVLISVRYTL